MIAFGAMPSPWTSHTSFLVVLSCMTLTSHTMVDQTPIFLSLKGKDFGSIHIHPRSYESLTPRARCEPHPPSTIISILRPQTFIYEAKESSTLFALFSKKCKFTRTHSTKRHKELLDEFKDLTPDNLFAGLPPMRNIQHAIDLILESALPNLPHHRLNPSEHIELTHPIDELLARVSFMKT